MSINKTLYSYSLSKLLELKDDEEVCAVEDILHLTDDIKSLPGMLDDSFFKNYKWIDITNFMSFTKDNALYSSRFLMEIEKIIVELQLDIGYLVNNNLKKIIFENIPLLFQQIDSNRFVELDVLFNKHEILLHTYSSKEEYENMEEIKKIIPFTNLVTINGNYSYSYNSVTVKEIIIRNSIEIIDLTSIVENVKKKFEDIMYLEQFISQVVLINNNIGFIIRENQKEFIEQNLNSFKITVNNLELNESKEAEDLFQLEKIYQYGEEITRRLYGHEKFKKDFIQKLINFSFLRSLNNRKMLSVFLFGKSGVGKTEFGKILSKTIYPSEKTIKINFGNYSNEGVLNSLIGSPLGYIGSDEGGELINKITDSASKVIIIDEFEKATPNVFNFFYELLEDGKFTDRQSNEHNLENYILIFTSNYSEDEFIESVPQALISRFDMIYNFNSLTNDEKMKFIVDYSENLRKKVFDLYEKTLLPAAKNPEILKLCKLDNLRTISREIDNLIVKEMSDK